MGNPILPEYNLQGAAERAALLVTLSGNTVKTVMDLNAVAYVGQALNSSAINGPGNEFPVYYWAQYGSSLLVLLLGVQTRAQGERVQNGYLSGAFFADVNDQSEFYVKYADDVRNSIPNFAPPPTSITIIGHSAGGCAAYFLSRMLFQRWATLAFTTVVCFGMPKAITRGLTTNYDPFFHCQSCNWINYDDPLPLLPPQTLTWTFSYGNGSLFGQRARVQSFIPPSKGKIIQSNLTISDGNAPPGISCPTTADFAAWYSLYGQQADSPHSLRTYVNRLTNAFALTPTPQPPPAPTPVPPAPPTPTPTMVRDAFAAQRATYTQQEGRNNAQIATYPESALFETVKEGNTWKVAYGGVVVAVGPGRKTAAALTRAGNELIKTLQRQGGVDPAMLTEQFTTMMGLATDPTSGFVPNIAPL